MARYFAISVEPTTTNGDTVNFTAIMFEPFYISQRSPKISESPTSYQAPIQSLQLTNGNRSLFET
jgi:hypothetical protein